MFLVGAEKACSWPVTCISLGAVAHWLPGEAWEAPCPRHVRGMGATVALLRVCRATLFVKAKALEGDGS